MTFSIAEHDSETVPGVDCLTLPERNKPAMSDGFDASVLRLVSHELRTPLHTIIGFADLLATEDGLDIAQRHDFATRIFLSH